MAPSEWAELDVVIRDLGAVVAAATYVRGSISKATADQAIREASEAVSRTISDPGGDQLLGAARAAIEIAHDVIEALDEEVARSHALSRRSVDLRGRALDLVEQARRAGHDPR
jgi:outer membrane murein-binding lipoprotein Lpp